MGWGNCGTDDLGRPIGYLHPGTCDHPGCDQRIFRGVDAVCGDMHGEDEHSCARYFCERHQVGYPLDWDMYGHGGPSPRVCPSCAIEALEGQARDLRARYRPAKSAALHASEGGEADRG